MASKRANAPHPGHEPAMGRPDPNAPRPANTGRLTHYPHSNGTVCGKRLTKAADYDTVAPTCTTCAQWLKSTQDFTRRKHPGAFPAPPPSPPAADEET